ncbi:MAG TPA: alpha-L-arabinofuranosidase C-terminal domain-containing protein [Phycisphaerae bacterium]|nr:alpha-L-arabinofuranosidase C-terminal domain-containing protein [Phycisphaerae bacterium]HRY67160.1 alpha-L-arabinofuranosidase C-terminal domain-containing protein [Phycisphaerae bacterium]HSA26471.1 alpha-L-arabinofuranosidase C-terminal domain-containing protein [Phycisphaerae bacterium]
MTRTTLRICVTALAGIASCSAAFGAETVTRLTIQADRPGAPISPTMYGVFFEDINYGADGGLLAEQVKNRSFEFPTALMGWSEAKEGPAAGSLQVLDQAPAFPVNPHYLRLKADGPGGYGVINEGFHGMGLRAGEEYLFSASVRGRGGQATLRVELVSPDQRVLAKTMLRDFGSDWKREAASLRPAATEPKARLRLILENPGTIDLDMISLFPHKTWRQRPNGLRPDLVQMLADLKPGFVRFPGGCIVEGRELATRYQWKTTIGKPEDRRLIVNRWNTEFKHRPAPDYFQSFGLGFFEYFLLCEDIAAQPLPILNCGMACQFNTGELAPLEQLDAYIQDALDLIQFANGSETSTWGSRRAEMGHPRPFNLRLLGVGNEQWGPQYIQRYERFAKVLKAKYPEVQLIASAGPRPADDLFRFLWARLRELQADIVDEHCYDRPEWFFDNAARYDNYPRSGPKVFMGEYAAQSVKTVSPDNRNDWRCALAEAAYMIGLERNADVVVMSSYAPLFGHEDGWQWRPNLIWFDNLNVYGTPSYYVQQLFSLHRGDVVLPVTIDGRPPASSKTPGLYATASLHRKTGEVLLKVVNSASEPVTAILSIKDAGKIAPQATAIVLAGAKPGDENSLAEPRRIAPVTSPVTTAGSDFGHTFPPSSLTVLRLRAGG